MSVKIENIEKNRVKLEIELDASVFDNCLNKAYVKNRSKYSVPGFRKGKAPRNLIERYYGESTFYEDAINFACADAYDDAIEQNEIKAVDKPEIDIVQIGSGQNFIFTATVTVMPEVELGEYKGLTAEKNQAIVTDDDVDEEIKKELEKRAQLVSVEDRPIESGDSVNIDYLGTVDDVPFAGGEAKGYTLVIGSGTFIPGFEDQLIGANIGDEVKVNVTFPEKYHSEELAGKAAVFTVNINEIKVKKLPELDDDFASDVSDFDTLDEYKTDIRAKLTQKAQDEADKDFANALIKIAVENAKCDIPDVMVEHRLDDLLGQFDRQLRYQGVTLEQYAQMMGMDIQKMRDDYRENALSDVKTQLVLEKIAVTEGIIASAEEYEAELEDISNQYGRPVEEFKKHLRAEDIEYIKDTIERRKTVNVLVENAK